MSPWAAICDDEPAETTIVDVPKLHELDIAHVAGLRAARAMRLRSRLRSGGRIVVIGGGFIGLEESQPPCGGAGRRC